jgi:hypothetical protein
MRHNNAGAKISIGRFLLSWNLEVQLIHPSLHLIADDIGCKLVKPAWLAIIYIDRNLRVLKLQTSHI